MKSGRVSLTSFEFLTHPFPNIAMAAFYWNDGCVSATHTIAFTNTPINIPPPYFHNLTEQVHTPSSKLSETSRCWDLNQYVALLYVNNQNFRFFDFLFKFRSNFSKQGFQEKEFI